jgi:thioredoxin-related protein
MQVISLLYAALLCAQTPSPTPEPAPPVQNALYDTKADAAVEIAAALVSAQANNRRVLLQWGANDAPACVRWQELLKQERKLSKTLSYEYDVVRIDVGKFDKHMELAAKYGAELGDQGLPYLTVLDKTGKRLANQATAAFKSEKAESYEPTPALEFLVAQQAPYEDAAELLVAAQARALADKKRVFLTFGAPSCHWCHKLENWLASPLPKKLLAKDFLILKIDVERTIGGQELKTSFRAKQDGIPWFCVLDAEGRVQAASVDANDENLGYPYSDEEIMAFATLLSTVAKNLSLEDIDKLQRSLVDVREADLKKQQEAGR